MMEKISWKDILIMSVCCFGTVALLDGCSHGTDTIAPNPLTHNVENVTGVAVPQPEFSMCPHCGFTHSCQACKDMLGDLHLELYDCDVLGCTNTHGKAIDMYNVKGE